jgi:SP family general alpha glucoside:H+ symporter-like MFS transporter
METKKNDDQYGIDIVHNEKATDNVDGAHHLENVEGVSSGTEWKHIIQDAIESEANERELNWRQAIKMYPKAIFWSIAISLCIVM